MKHKDLLKYVGKDVRVLFKDGTWVWGKLGYADEFSAKHNYRKINHFYVGDTTFLVSHVKKLAESEDTNDSKRVKSSDQASHDGYQQALDKLL